MTKRYFMAGLHNCGIAVLNNQGISASKFPAGNMLKIKSDSPASKKVILS